MNLARGPQVRSAPSVYNIPPGAPFLTTLAKALKDKLGEDLPSALILLPTRRAVRELGNAFVMQSSGKSASLLPRMRPLADVDPEEPPFEPGELLHLVRPAISSAQRRFALARLVLEKEKRLTGVTPDAAAALALTDPLISLLDDVAMEGITPDAIEALSDISDRVAAHYQHAAVFYDIIRTWWPKYLGDEKLMDPMARRVALLQALRDHWQDKPPQTPVIIAGSTGTLQASADLMATVASLPRGAVVLPGLDINMDEEAWRGIDSRHPQNALKNLIATIGVDRKAVTVWGDDSQNPRTARRRILAEALIPVDEASDWPARIEKLKSSETVTDVFKEGLQGLSLIEARTDDQEAASIAVMMRETLEHDDLTAALITPDPALARRVRAKLARWSIKVDSSAGLPLEETPLGIFLALVMRLALDPCDSVTLAALMKHPLLGLGRAPETVRMAFSHFERAVLHGPRFRTPEAMIAKAGEDIAPVLTALYAALSPLGAMDKSSSMDGLARLHIHAAETLAQTETLLGAARLWHGEAGEKAAQMLSDLIQYGASLPRGDGVSYQRLVGSLMRGKVVRPRAGTEPRLFILGPLEARLLNFDLTIMGGLNEGVWPSAPVINPFLSRGMRRAIGLSAPERRFGLSAHDFVQGASAKRVVLTRSEKSSDGPTVASRWIWRLKTLVIGALGEERAQSVLSPNQPILAWAKALDERNAGTIARAERPRFAPPVKARWPQGRKLGVTTLKTLIRDPYALYANRILGLKALDPLDHKIGARERGSAIHEALEAYFKSYSGTRTDAATWLTNRMESDLLRFGFAPESLPQERVRLQVIAEDFLRYQDARILGGWKQVGAELKGHLDIPIEGGAPFRITALVDRIEQCGAEYAVFDYKTGSAPSRKEVEAGFDVQLPLTAKIIEYAGLYPENHPNTLSARAGAVNEYGYIMTKAHGKFCDKVIGKTADDVQAQSSDAYVSLQNLIAYFDDPTTPYLSQPRAKYTNPYGDYDHLARRGEWARLGDDSDEEGV